MRALSRRFSLNRKLLSPLRKEAATLLGTPQGSKGQQLVNRLNVNWPAKYWLCCFAR